MWISIILSNDLITSKIKWFNVLPLVLVQKMSQRKERRLARQLQLSERCPPTANVLLHVIICTRTHAAMRPWWRPSRKSFTKGLACAASSLVRAAPFTNEHCLFFWCTLKRAESSFHFHPRCPHPPALAIHAAHWLKGKEASMYTSPFPILRESRMFSYNVFHVCLKKVECMSAGAGDCSGSLEKIPITKLRPRGRL